MQFKKIILGTSTIILLLFSFPKSYCFRNDICSQKNSNLSLNCEDRKIQSIYHQYERHLDNSNQQFDVRRVRQLQIRSINNDRDLSGKNQIHSRVTDRLVERGHSYFRLSQPDRDLSTRNRENTILTREIRLLNINSQNRLIVRERRSSSRDTERRSSPENNNNNSRITERRNFEASERFRVNNMQTTERIQNSRERITPKRESYERDSNLSEMRKSTDRETRDLERRLVRDTRISKRSAENNIRNIERNRQPNERISTRSYIHKEIRTDRRISEDATRLPERYINNNIRDAERRFVDRISNDQTTNLSQEQNLPFVEKVREFRQVRERVSPERITRVSERRSRRFLENIPISERTLESHNRIQERERISPGELTRVSERRISNIRSSRRLLPTFERSSEAHDRVYDSERSSTERMSRVFERRTLAIQSSRRSLPSFERSRESRDRVQENKRISRVQDHISSIRNLQRSLEYISLSERTRESRNRIHERISPERRSADRDFNIRSSRRSVDNIPYSERTRQSRERLQEREQTPVRETRVSERRSADRIFVIRNSRLSADRESHNRNQEQERTSLKRESIISTRSSMNNIRTTDRNREFNIERRFNIREIRNLERRTRELSIDERNTKQRQNNRRSITLDTRNIRDTSRISRSVNIRDTRLLERSPYERNYSEHRETENIYDQRRIANQRVESNIRNLRLSERFRQSERRDSRNSRERNISSHQRLLSDSNEKASDRRVRDTRQMNRSFQNHDQQSRNSDSRNEVRNSKRSVENTNHSEQRISPNQSLHSRQIISNRIRQNSIRIQNDRREFSLSDNIGFESELGYRNRQNHIVRDARNNNRRFLDRSIENESRNSERMTTSDRTMNELNKQKIMSRISERLTDKTRSKYNQKISDRRHGKQNGFRYIFDQQDISVFRVYPTNKVQEMNVENQNIWINVVKIFLACLLFLQISRNKTADLKMFQSIKIPILSQLIKAKVQ